MDTVFYSWQSDLPGKTNRNLIEDALDQAARAIRNDESISVQPVIDRDTVGVPGSPDIARTIFDKIDAASVFVCDVSFINFKSGARPRGSKPRLTPNPNVLVELGYALRALGHERIILVMNEEYGPLSELPFDLKQRRVIPYRASLEQTDRADVRRALSQRLQLALRTILDITAATKTASSSVPVLAPLDEARIAAAENRPNQSVRVRQYMTWLFDELRKLAPSQESNASYDALSAALATTTGHVADFARLAEDIAVHNSAVAARTVFKAFERIAGFYSTPEGFSGTYFEHWFDFYRFIGHELFVTLAALLIREDRWELLSDLLRGELYVPNNRVALSTGTGSVVSWEYLSMGVILLTESGGAPSNRVSAHADLLNARHTQGELGEVLPAKEFIDGDYLLFLRSVMPSPVEPQYAEWDPWSTLYMRHVPRYLIDARNGQFAVRFMNAIGVENVTQFRERFHARNRLLKLLFRQSPRFFPLHDYKVDEFGTR